ncbi:MAG: hypothetical protein Q7J51_05390 [Sheuella sp.]|nr:hypothetical protein [Sheuella sp.]
MTTNVYDKLTGMMATDSRWSIEWGGFLLYIDDSGFDKIELFNDCAVMFAGDSAEIEKWKRWMAINPSDLSEMPEPVKINVCISRESDLQVIYQYKQSIIDETGYFAGTGTNYALQCWLKNRDAKKAVATATLSDHRSGGDVMYYDLKNKSSNLSSRVLGEADLSAQYVSAQILSRGSFMNMALGLSGSISFDQALLENPDLKEMKDMISAGTLTASAPFEGMGAPWPDEERQKLKNAMQSILDAKK